ncbi:ABC-F family ATP-binding cassette domain-containing protein [Marinobacterium sp. 3-1745]|uniref:ABC-F family ATP-binding cassette domain-containing protein n=2 Tax=Marinobacterium marinum TaxID=2756129 RepID=A0A7W1WXZ9_9GAMM|nr:ABC-F family ATP-binding cassette domain-containing protein [Marinobacterium marinum]
MATQTATKTGVDPSKYAMSVLLQYAVSRACHAGHELAQQPVPRDESTLADLAGVQRIVELSSLGLSSYGENYTFYVEAREQERRNALQNLDALKHERRRSEQAMRLQRERQERRQTRGKQLSKTANQAKILLDRQKERSESASGALRKQQVGSQAKLNQRIHEAAQAVATETPIAVHAAPVPRPYRRTLAELIDVKLPYLPDTSGPVSLTLSGQQRVGVEGNNGCGKSTLLRVLSGQLAPVDGKIRVTDEVAYLDQALEVLDPNQTILDQLKRANSGAAEAGLRTRLAQLGLDAQKIMVPSGVLSGGERLKAALACVLYAERPVQLLMLDEPSNHLDLPSLEALEAMLREYRGGLLVVSHDERLLERIQLTDRLRVTEKGWRLLPS